MPKETKSLCALTLKQKYWIVRLTLAVGEGAHRLCALVLKAGEHLAEAVGPKPVEEPLDVGPGEALEGVEAQTRVLDDHRPLDDLCCRFAFLYADLVNFALIFRQIDLLARDLPRKVLTQNGDEFLQFLRVPRHEYYWLRHSVENFCFSK